jgi:hypothetical protein
MSLDLKIIAAKGYRNETGDVKGHQDMVIAHGCYLNDTDVWRHSPQRRGFEVEDGTTVVYPAELLAPALVAFHGKHPAELLAQLPKIARAIRKQPWSHGLLNDVRIACTHALEVETHPRHGELYEDVRVSISVT